MLLKLIRAISHTAARYVLMVINFQVLPPPVTYEKYIKIEKANDNK